MPCVALLLRYSPWLLCCLLALALSLKALSPFKKLNLLKPLSLVRSPRLRQALSRTRNRVPAKPQRYWKRDGIARVQPASSWRTAAMSALALMKEGEDHEFGMGIGAFHSTPPLISRNITGLFVGGVGGGGMGIRVKTRKSENSLSVSHSDISSSQEGSKNESRISQL